MKKVICVIADIVDSRGIRDRSIFQKSLQKALVAISASHSDFLSPYTITLGDEFQAVYKSGDYLFRDFAFIQHAIYPSKVRFSVGVGALTTSINTKLAIGMDGPAFHLAREGITTLKKTSCLFRILTSDSTQSTWVNPSLDLISHIETNWKKNRYQILYGLLNNAEVKIIAKRVRLTPAAVYKSIRAGALDAIARIYGEIGEMIRTKL